MGIVLNNSSVSVSIRLAVVGLAGLFLDDVDYLEILENKVEILKFWKALCVYVYVTKEALISLNFCNA